MVIKVQVLKICDFRNHLLLILSILTQDNLKQLITMYLFIAKEITLTLLLNG